MPDIKTTIQNTNTNNNSYTNPYTQTQEVPVDTSNPQFPIYKDDNGVNYVKMKLFESIVSLGGGGAGMGNGFTFVPSGATPFRGMSIAEKMRCCGITSNFMTPAEVQAAGLLTQVTLNQTNGKYIGQINKAVANDLANICNEICRLGFFNLRISNTFRNYNTVSSGVSKHCWGVALDINPTNGCPWFNTHIPRTFTEPALGSAPPWPFKKYSCGNYDRSTCIWTFDHPVVKIFEGHGWGWGGAYGDSMHFSLMDGH